MVKVLSCLLSLVVFVIPGAQQTIEEENKPHDQHSQASVLRHFTTLPSTTSDVDVASLPLKFLENSYLHHLTNHSSSSSSSNDALHANMSVVVHYPQKMLKSNVKKPVSNTCQRVDRDVNTNTIAKATCKNDRYCTIGGFSNWPGHSQMMEDVWAYESWFFGCTNGIIVESGGLDGLEFSNSYFFSKFLNWTSINVEAASSNYELLIQNRKESININAALCTNTAPLHLIQNMGPISGIFEFMERSYIEKFHSEFLDSPDKIDTLEILACVPPKYIFAALKLEEIDIWVIDVEGAEMDVLLGVDFEAVYIKTIIMECDQQNITKDDEKRALLKDKGYTCQQLLSNCMCKHESFKPVLGGIYEGYPIIGDAKSMYYMEESVVHPFQDYDAYTEYTEKTGNGLRKVPDLYIQTHTPPLDAL